MSLRQQLVSGGANIAAWQRQRTHVDALDEALQIAEGQKSERRHAPEKPILPTKPLQTKPREIRVL